jgi:hypothetical protein
MAAESNPGDVTLTTGDVEALKAVLFTLKDSHFKLKKSIDRIEANGADDAYASLPV